MATSGNEEKTIKVTTQEIKDFAQYKLTREYLRRALLKLKHATEFFDQDIDEVEEEEESIQKFIGEVKRKNLV